MSEKILIPEKSYSYYSLLTLTKLKDFMLHDEVTLLTKTRSGRGTRNRQQRIFRKVWTIYILQNIDQEINFC